MLPESEMAVRMASVLSSQIVHPTAPADSPRSRMAAPHRRPRGIVSAAVPADNLGAGAATPCGPGLTRALPNMR
jgi:hypothetical protein